MGVTLNGIGQGYITDRVVELLRGGGVEHALVDMGKTRAIGGHPRRRPLVGRAGRSRSPGMIAERILLADRALATAGGMALCLTRPAASTIFPSRGAAAPAGAGSLFSVESATATEVNSL